MASKIDVYNMALSNIGSSETVADELERSPERVTCSRFWDTCRDALLSYKDVEWKFATTTVALADLGTPPEGWGFRYRYPNDCINALEIMSGYARATPEEFKPKFDIQYEANGRVILCDIEDAVLKYTKRVEEAERWPAYFVEAMAARLASFIAAPLKKDLSTRNDMIQLAEQLIQVAIAASLNEGQPDGPFTSIYEGAIHQ
jgi:hypothetical protein